MKWIYRFFILLGVIFFFILIGLTYFIVVDPLNLRPLIMSMYDTNATPVSVDVPAGEANTSLPNTSTSESGTPAVSRPQAQALEAIGINTDAVPTKFTPEQTACFVNILGQARVDAIVSGVVPTPSEFYQAKECL